MTTAYYHCNVVGEPDSIEVLGLEWDEENIEHLSRHNLERDQVAQVRSNAPRFFRNLPDRTATHVMVGPDDLGQFYYISLAPTSTPGRWRPITGWRLGRRALDLYNKGATS